MAGLANLALGVGAGALVASIVGRIFFRPSTHHVRVEVDGVATDAVSDAPVESAVKAVAERAVEKYERMRAQALTQ